MLGVLLIGGTPIPLCPQKKLPPDCEWNFGLQCLSRTPRTEISQVTSPHNIDALTLKGSGRRDCSLHSHTKARCGSATLRYGFAHEGIQPEHHLAHHGDGSGKRRVMGGRDIGENQKTMPMQKAAAARQGAA
jgi:hypothetical protein